MSILAVKAALGIYVDATLGGGGYSEAIFSVNPAATSFWIRHRSGGGAGGLQSALEKFRERFSKLSKRILQTLHDALSNHPSP